MMKTILSSKKLIDEFPIHDAIMYSFCVEQDNQGGTSLKVLVQMDDDCFGQNEECSNFYPSGRVSLVFNRCWYIKSNFFCDLTNADSIDSLDLIEDSKELRRIIDKASGVVISHYRVLLHSGSEMEVISEELFCESEQEKA